MYLHAIANVLNSKDKNEKLTIEQLSKEMAEHTDYSGLGKDAEREKAGDVEDYKSRLPSYLQLISKCQGNEELTSDDTKGVAFVKQPLSPKKIENVKRYCKEFMSRISLEGNEVTKLEDPGFITSNPTDYALWYLFQHRAFPVKGQDQIPAVALPEGVPIESLDREGYILEIGKGKYSLTDEGANKSFRVAERFYKERNKIWHRI